MAKVQDNLFSDKNAAPFRPPARPAAAAPSVSYEFLCCRVVTNVVFHSRDFPVPISRDPDDFFIPAFPGNRCGIPGNRIEK
jgi:hypothetical protein